MARAGEGGDCIFGAHNPVRSEMAQGTGSQLPMALDPGTESTSNKVKTNLVSRAQEVER